MAAPDTDADPTGVVYRDLGLVWGVKSSLLSYLAALPDTEIELFDGRYAAGEPFDDAEPRLPAG
ncbi:hypothetical protein [Actinomadura sp. CNU-125]|uniref:hypothetical protein n=1 Tax=Actinomadura sp. CNU-125 TaxID=1904961 RepID=UPI00117749BB|nr:hypothetical protein [Actinomadura sp. CNU-125]